MKTFRKILVPTDFSEHAHEAMLVASDLSRRYEAPVTLIYVYEPVAYALPDGYVMYTSAQLNRMFAEFDHRLAQARREATEAGALNVDTRLLQGYAPTEICEHASLNEFDLIVMGTHGRRGIKHFLLGSVAERVVRTAPCPVLTVRAPK